MKEQTATLISELYKEKSNIFSDLEKLTSKDFLFLLGYEVKGFIGGKSSLGSISSDFAEKVKKQIVEHLQERAKQIDKQIEQL